MKLLRIISTALLCWNTVGILVLLWRYRAAQNRANLLGSYLATVTEKHNADEERSTSTTKNLAESRMRPRINGDVRKFQEEHLNVPNIYLNMSRVIIDDAAIKSRKAFNARSPYFPQLREIKFNNIYWQTFTGQQATYFLYNAYYDDRESSTTGQNWVRVIGMVDTLPPPPVKCALWFDDGKYMVWASDVIIEHLWHKAWGAERNGTLHPYLISCLLPYVYRQKKSSKKLVVTEKPLMVSIVHRSQRRPTTNLKISHKPVNEIIKNDFAVCVKGLEFPSKDISTKLLEWVHLLHLLGADKVFFYELDVHPKVAQTLDHLQSKGMIKVIPLTLPGHQPNFPQLRELFLHRYVHHKRLNEIIPYNDCLYRNIYLYKYVVLLDIDEVIMPLNTDSWTGLMHQIQSEVKLKTKARRPSSYNAQNVYFFDDLEHQGAEMEEIPTYLHMCRHVIRSATFSKEGHYVKCFHDTTRVRALHNHFPFSCLAGFRPCASFQIDSNLAELQHYRPDCHDMNVTTCRKIFKSKTILDLSIWRFKKRLMGNVLNDLIQLQLN